jgi:hypothetical protein
MEPRFIGMFSRAHLWILFLGLLEPDQTRPSHPVSSIICNIIIQHVDEMQWSIVVFIKAVSGILFAYSCFLKIYFNIVFPRVCIRQILGNQDWMVWTGLIWIRIGTSDELL